MKFSSIIRIPWMNSAQNWPKAAVLCIGLLACICSPSMAATNLSEQSSASSSATLQDMLAAGFSACALTDGGYIFSSSIASDYDGSKDILLIKTDDAGKILWQKQYGGKGDEEANTIRKTADGGYILVGSTTSFESLDIYLLKLDANGKVKWEKNYGGRNDSALNKDTTNKTTLEYGYKVSEISSSKGLSKDYYDTFVLTKDQGSTDETTTDTSTYAEDAGFDVVASSDGGYVLTGYTQPNGGVEDIVLLKVDYRGVLQWVRSLGGGSDERANSLQECRDKGFIIAGYTRSVGIGSRLRASGDASDRTDKDAYLIKTDSNGYIKWQKTYGRVNDDESSCVLENDQGFLLAGYTIRDSKTNNPSILLIQTNQSGNFKWEAHNNSSAAVNVARGVLSLINGDIFIAANTIQKGAAVTTLLQYNQSGVFVGEKAWPGTGNTITYGLLESQGNKLIVYGTMATLDNTQPDQMQINPFILEYDSTGKLLADKIIAGSNLNSRSVEKTTIDPSGTGYSRVVPEGPMPKGSRGSR